MESENYGLIFIFYIVKKGLESHFDGVCKISIGLLGL